MHTEGVGTVPKGSKEERLSFPGLGSGDSWHKALPVCPSEQRPALGASEGGAWGKWPGDRGRLGVSGGPPRGARDTYLSQLVILDQLWSVPVDQGIEGEPVLPAVDRKAEIRRTASHCHRRTAGQGAHRKDQRPWGVVQHVCLALRSVRPWASPMTSCYLSFHLCEMRRPTRPTLHWADGRGHKQTSGSGRLLTRE